MLLEFFGRFKRGSREEPRRRNVRPKSTAESGDPQLGQEAEIPGGSNSAVGSGGFFANSSGFVLNRSNLIDIHDQRSVQTVVTNINTGTTALERLLPHICLDATVDSSARHPPPLCHPGTRKRIRNKLETWIDNPQRQRNMIWLSGPAGTGKSAVAQTFAELCLEKGRLGAAFFFSRLNERDDPKTIIPTLAYQLAVYSPEYRSLLTHRISHDFAIFQKTPRTQLKNLIVEPFSILQMQGHRVTREPFLILLDGLDECKGINAQCEFVEMVGEVIRLKKDLPLLWLICSRPEPHLKYLFLRADYAIDCDKEELPIDAETRDDVDQYLRDGFRGIRKKFWDVASASWPSEDQLLEVLNIASGLFILASTILRYIGDVEYANPMARLTAFLAFMKGVDRLGAKNPLEALDLFYSRILSDIPDDVFLTTRRILSFCSKRRMRFIRNSHLLSSTQTLCNFLDLDQGTFYNALRKLHSVVDVHPPETAAKARLQFYHASFEDYLCDSARCGKFVTDEETTQIEISKLCLFWYKIDLELFHVNDTPFDIAHDHGILPGLKWVSPDNSEEISHRIAKFSELNCWRLYCRMSTKNVEDLLFPLYGFNFQYIVIEFDTADFLSFTNWLWKLGPSNTILRTVPCNNFDLQLLASVITEATESEPLEPATFPLGRDGDLGVEVGRDNLSGNQYFFIGHGHQTCLFWFSYAERRILGRARFLSGEQPLFDRPSGCLVMTLHLNWYSNETERYNASIKILPRSSASPDRSIPKRTP